MTRNWELGEWISRAEMRRLENMRDFHSYLGTTMKPSRPDAEIIGRKDMVPIEVTILRDPPRD